MRHAAVILFLALCCCPAPRVSAAAAQPEVQPQPQYNFLFIVDTSLSMASRKSSISVLCREMIASGFYGQIGAGDSIDIWTYDTETHLTEFPPQIWSTNRAEQIATAAASFIGNKRFKGRSRFLGVEQDLHSLLPNTKALMVFLITDGDETLSGTGFDSEINPQLARVKRQLPGASEPFLVTLLAIEGRFTDWRIFGGRGRPLLPTLPVRRAPEPEQTITGTELRHNKGKIVESAQFNGEPAEPHRKPDEKERFHQQMPIVFNFPPGANVVAPTTAVAAPLNMAHATTNLTLPSRTNAAVAQTSLAAASNSIAASASVPAARPEPKTIIKQIPPATNAVIAKTERPLKVKSPQAPVEVSTAPPPAPVPQTASISNRKVTVAAAGGGGAMCLLLGITLFSRRNKPKKEPSLISKSMGR